MTKVLVRTKATPIVPETPVDESMERKRLKPGMWIQYVVYHLTDKLGRRGRQTGRGFIELVRARAPELYVRELGGWIFKSDVAMLPEDRWPKKAEAPTLDTFLTGEKVEA